MSHQHEWRMATHMDGCHWSESIYACDCGAMLHEYAERDISDDPYAYVWMDTDAVDCPRCRDLLNGDTPDTRSEVVAAP